MNVMLKQIVRNKITTVTPSELIQQAKNYQVDLTENQAEKIVQMLSKDNLDPFKKTDLAQMIHYLTQLTDQETVKKAKIILNKIIKQYNATDWFY